MILEVHKIDGPYAKQEYLQIIIRSLLTNLSDTTKMAIIVIKFSSEDLGIEIDVRDNLLKMAEFHKTLSKCFIEVLEYIREDGDPMFFPKEHSGWGWITRSLLDLPGEDSIKNLKRLMKEFDRKGNEVLRMNLSKIIIKNNEYSTKQMLREIDT